MLKLPEIWILKDYYLPQIKIEIILNGLFILVKILMNICEFFINFFALNSWSFKIFSQDKRFEWIQYLWLWDILDSSTFRWR